MQLQEWNEGHALLELEQTTYLGPACVMQTAGRRLLLKLPSELAWAALALASPYEPTPGDSVLAIGQAGTWYVLGVLQGSGKTTLTVPADLELRAPQGSIELVSGREVRITSPHVSITAKKLDVVAQTVFESFVQVTRWIKEAFQVRAGRVRMRVASTYDVKAERIMARAEGDVKIDGHKIHLG